MVQDREVPMHGTGFMAKSLRFVWALLGTEPYYVVDVESHEEILRESRGCWMSRASHFALLACAKM